MTKRGKIPTYDELVPRVIYADEPFLKLGISLFDYRRKLSELFEKFNITQVTSDLVVDLFELLSEALRKFNERLDLSKLEWETNRQIYKNFLALAKNILETPHFIEFMELDRDVIELIELKAQILERKIQALKGTSGGHRKLLKAWIPIVRFRLHQAGLKTNRQVEFLIEFFKIFEVLELCSDREEVRATIYDWFKDTKESYNQLLTESPP